MSQVQVTYDGDRHCTALQTRNGRTVFLDCPVTHGKEFAPGSLVASGLAGCMLISMATFADRHGVDISGTRVDVDMSMSDGPEAHIGSIELAIRVPGEIPAAERKGLEKAAEACPIKHSFRPDTTISTRFEFGSA